jgi:hypothetical protein
VWAYGEHATLPSSRKIDAIWNQFKGKMIILGKVSSIINKHDSKNWNANNIFHIKRSRLVLAILHALMPKTPPSTPREAQLWRKQNVTDYPHIVAKICIYKTQL